MNNSNSTQNLLSDLEPFKKERQISVVLDRDLEAVLTEITKIYEWNLSIKPNISSQSNKFYEILLEKFLHISITPATITRFTENLAAYKDHERFMHITGQFVTALLQMSYNQGHNNFTIDFSYLYRTPAWLCADLKGKPNNILNVKLTGKPSKYFGSWSEFVSLSPSLTLNKYRLLTLDSYC